MSEQIRLSKPKLGFKPPTVQILFFISMIFSFSVGTEYIAYKLGRWGLGEFFGLHAPFDGLLWFIKAKIRGLPDDVFTSGFQLTMLSMLVFSLLLFLLKFSWASKVEQTDTHGSAKWAEREDLVKAGLLMNERSKFMVYFFNILAFLSKSFGLKISWILNKSEEFKKTREGLYVGGWHNEKKKATELLIDNTDSHAIAIAPTRSGKGTSIVIPNVLTWEGSLIVYDIKGENFVLTSGYRKNNLNNYVFAFNPGLPNDGTIEKEILKNEKLDGDLIFDSFIKKGWLEKITENKGLIKRNIQEIENEIEKTFPEDHEKIITIFRLYQGGYARFNPLNEIRMGTYEVKDAQTMARILVNTKEGITNTHWNDSAEFLLTGVILHVLYSRKDKTLRGVLSFLSDPSRRIRESLQAMLNTHHDPTGELGWIDNETGKKIQIHPEIAKIARGLLDRHDEELSGVVSTATTILKLYLEPNVARNTEKSDFAISDIIKADRPVTLYIIIPNDDKERLEPLTRLMISLICSRVMGNISDFKGNLQKNRHRLLFMLDEFTSLGRMEVIKRDLSFMAGYGIRVFMIIQDLDQLNSLYGNNNPFMGLCKIKIAFAPNSHNTARCLTEYLGSSTVYKLTKSISGNNPGSSNQGISEVNRPLLTSDEVLRLPKSDMLVFIENERPIYGKKTFYYKIPNFMQMAEKGCIEKSDSIECTKKFPLSIESTNYRKRGSKTSSYKEKFEKQERPEDLKEEPKAIDTPGI